MRHFRPDAAIDLEPAGDVPGEMRSGGAGDERDTTSDPFRSLEPSADDAEGARARPCELEQGRCGRVEIGIDVADLRADVAAAVAESSRGLARAVEPSKPGQSQRSRVAAEQEGRVGRTRDGWKSRRDRVQRPFVTEPSERRKGAGL